MNIRFIDQDGIERVTDGFPKFIAVMKERGLPLDTLVFDRTDLRWKKASDIEEVRRAAAGLDLPVTAAVASPRAEDAVVHPDLPESSLDVRSTLAGEPPTYGSNGQTRPEANEQTLHFPVLENTTRQQSPFLTWARSASGPTVYATTLGLSYALVQSISHLVKDEFVALGISVVGAIGFIMSVRGLFRRTRTLTRLELTVVGVVVLTFPAVVGVVAFGGQRQKAVVAKASSEVRGLRQSMDAAVQASGMDEVLQMLDGEKPFDMSVVAKTRSHTNDLITLLDSSVSRTDSLLKEMQSGLAETNPALEYLENVGHKMKQGYSVRREFFAEMRRLLDFLTSKSGSYSVGPQGLQFRVQSDADTFNASLKKVADYQTQLESIRAEITGARPSQRAPH